MKWNNEIIISVIINDKWKCRHQNGNSNNEMKKKNENNENIVRIIEWIEMKMAWK